MPSGTRGNVRSELLGQQQGTLPCLQESLAGCLENGLSPSPRGLVWYSDRLQPAAVL